MRLDDARLQELIVESQDLQADALRDTKSSLGALRDIGASRRGKPVDIDQVRRFNADRRRLLRNGGYGMGALAARGMLATGFGTALTAIVARPAGAQEDLDISILQTAASLENLAVATYAAALTLPGFDANAVVVTFAETTMMQHDEHGEAFNAMAEALGGQAQEQPNPALAPMVEEAKAGLVGADGTADYAAIVELAALLEETAGDTYLANLTMLSDTESIGLMASVQGVEVQHLATLRAVGALLASDNADLIAIPTDIAALPAAAGSVAFPEPFEQANLARGAEEGAVQ